MNAWLFLKQLSCDTLTKKSDDNIIKTVIIRLIRDGK
jgi:hypothetical protein